MGKKVLLVEDENSVILVNSRFIQSMDLECLVAKDSKTALELLDANEDIGLVLLDYVLEDGGTGDKIAEIIQEKEIPFLVTSIGTVDKSPQQIFGQYNPLGYIRKTDFDAIGEAALTYCVK